MILKILAITVLMNLASLSLIGQKVMKSIIYRGHWEKPYGPIYSKLVYESDSILTYTLVRLIEKEEKSKRFVENTNSRLRFIVKGDSIFSEQDSINSLVFSPIIFKEKDPSYFIKSYINHLELLENSLYIYYPDTILRVQGEICYRYHLYYINTYESLKINIIKDFIMKNDIASLDGNFVKYYWYFFPDSGLVFFQESDLVGYEIIEGKKIKSLFNKDSFWRKNAKGK